MLPLNHRIQQPPRHLPYLIIHLAQYLVVDEESLEFLEGAEDRFELFLGLEGQEGVLLGLEVMEQLLKLEGVAMAREDERGVEGVRECEVELLPRV